MDNRLREIEQWVAEARDGLGDGGREAYVRKLYLLDAEIRAVIKDSGILPQVVSPRPATSLVRRLSSLALPVASALVVLAVSTVYLRGGIPEMLTSRGAGPTNSDFSILTARPDGAQKNTPPAGPSSTPQDWRDYLARNGEEVVAVDITVDEPVATPARQPVILASVNDQDAGVAPGGAGESPAKGETLAEPPGPPKTVLAAARKPAAAEANESTSVAPAGFFLASYTPPPAPEEPAAADPPLRRNKNRKAVDTVEPLSDELEIDVAEIIAKVEEDVFKR